jgi:hypothetical protein
MAERHDSGPTHAELLAGDTAAYFRAVIDCASIGGPCNLADPGLYRMATNLAQLAAEAIRDDIEGNWSAEYDIWLARATCHSSMAACRAQEGQG